MKYLLVALNKNLSERFRMLSIELVLVNCKHRVHHSFLSLLSPKMYSCKCQEWIRVQSVLVLLSHIAPQCIKDKALHASISKGKQTSKNIRERNDKKMLLICLTI